MSTDDRDGAKAGAAIAATRTRAATDLLPKYVAHRERDVATLRAALAQGDFETMARIGHNLRGNGVSYGFPEIAALGEAMEQAVTARQARGIEAQVALLEEWLARVGARVRTER